MWNRDSRYSLIGLSKEKPGERQQSVQSELNLELYTVY